MQKIYLTENGIVKECDSIVKNCWVALTDPTNAEITQIAQQFHIDISDVRASLDEEERSRIETEDDYTLIVVDIPIKTAALTATQDKAHSFPFFINIIN